MADNVTLNAGSGGSVAATDDVSSVHYQVVKLADGTADATTRIAAGGGVEANALRVTVASDSTGVLTVDGTVTANLGATDNAVLDSIVTATQATQAAVEGTLTVGSHAVTNAGTFAVQVDGAALTALQLLDDVVATDDTSTHATGSTKGAVMMAAATPTDGTVDANDLGALAMSTDRRLLVDAQIVGTDAALDVSGATVTVTGTVTANLGATDNAVLDSIVTATQATQAAVEGTLTVGSHAVTNAGTFAVQVDGAALTALQLLDDAVFADDAAFTLASSKVSMAGAVRDDTLSALTAVEGDAVPLRVNSTGALHVTGGGGGTEYVVDDALGATPTGSVVLATRDDALSTLTPVEGDAVTLRTDANGALWVIPSGTVTVSGTVTADLGATDNAVLDSIATATQATQAAVEGTLTVGSHAVTNAGTFAVQVDGAALTALQLLDDVVATDDTSTHATGSTKGAVMMAAATPTDGTVDANDLGALAMSTDRRLLVDAQIVGTDAALDVSGATVTVDGSGVTQPVSAASLPLPTGAATAAKQPALGTAGSAASDVISVQGIASMTALVVDGSAVTQPVSGTVTANLSATDNAVLDVIETNTSGSTSHYRNVDANAEAAIKGSGGTLHWLHAMNMTAAVAYVHLYDATTASVTPGTTTPDFTFPLATQGDTNGAGFVLPAPIEFATAITLVVTTTIDGSTGDPGTNGVFVNAGYT